MRQIILATLQDSLAIAQMGEEHDLSKMLDYLGAEERLKKILQKQDISPLRDFSEIFFTLSHEASVKGVLEGKYDAAAVYDNAPLLLSELANKSLIAIADTEAIPTDPMVVNSDLEASLKTSLQSAMTNMHNDEEGKKLLTVLYESRGIERYITEAEVQEIIRLGDSE